MVKTYRVSGQFDFLSTGESPSVLREKIRKIIRAGGIADKNFELSIIREEKPVPIEKEPKVKIVKKLKQVKVIKIKKGEKKKWKKD